VADRRDARRGLGPVLLREPRVLDHGARRPTEQPVHRPVAAEWAFQKRIWADLEAAGWACPSLTEAESPAEAEAPAPANHCEL
jgi:hypothetical protein